MMKSDRNLFTFQLELKDAQNISPNSSQRSQCNILDIATFKFTFVEENAKAPDFACSPNVALIAAASTESPMYI